MLPVETFIQRDDTHRLIPSRYSERGENVLADIAEDDAHLADIVELDKATNTRIVGQATGLPGISRELVFGVPYFYIINGCFANPNPFGNRFSGPERGAWYCGFSLRTAKAEIAYHRTKWYAEIDWREEEISTYVDYLADFRGKFHDIRNDPEFIHCLDPDDYGASQALAHTLLAQGSSGIVYPSVRHKGGTCLACFRPLLVGNVRHGDMVKFRFDPASSIVRVISA